MKQAASSKRTGKGAPRAVLTLMVMAGLPGWVAIFERPGHRKVQTGPPQLRVGVELTRWQSTPRVTHKICRRQPCAPAHRVRRMLSINDPGVSIRRSPYRRTSENSVQAKFA